MATLGKIDEFVPITGDWMHHIEWMNQVFVSSNITEETKKKSNFVEFKWCRNIQLIKKLVTPAKLSEKPYNELIEMMDEGQNPKASIIVDRYKFS